MNESTGPQVGDAFGRLLLDVYHAGEGPGEAFEIVEREDGYLMAGDAQRYFRSEAFWRADVRWAVQHARGRTLDVGVGAGRHALVAQAAGCQVVGLDPSPGALEVSRRRGVAEVRQGMVEEVADLFPASSFDTVMMMGQNLALLGSPTTAGAVLRALHRVTAPGAVLIGESSDPAHSVSRRHQGYFQWNTTRGRWPGQMVLRVRHLSLATSWFDYFFCSPAELSDLAETHGWRLDAVRSDGPNYVAILGRIGGTS